MLNQRLWLILGFLVVFLLACTAGLFSIILSIQNANNCKTVGAASITASDPTVTVREYFVALKNKDFNKACTYFDPTGTIEAGNKSQPVSSELLKSLNVNKGVLQSFSIIDRMPGTENTVIIVVDVTRSDQDRPSELRLTLQKGAGGWKIRKVNGL